MCYYNTDTCTIWPNIKQGLKVHQYLEYQKIKDI